VIIVLTLVGGEGDAVELPGIPAGVDLRSLPPDQLLDLLDEVADADAASKRNANTKRAYTDDWALWTQFCAGLDVDPLTARSGLFYTYVDFLERKEFWYKSELRRYSYASVERRFYGVVSLLRWYGVPVDATVTAKARAELDDFRIRLLAADEKRGRGKAAPISSGQLLDICHRLPASPWGVRNRAILLIGVAIAARRSELANLLVTDVVEDPAGRGLLVTVRVSKGGKGRQVPVMPTVDPSACPVRAWRAWTELAGIHTGPAFRGIHWRSEGVQPKGLTVQTIGEIWVEMGQLIGVALSGHSGRRTRITDLFGRGIPAEQICRISGHSIKSGTVHDYNDPIEIWNNPAVELGI
jgi:integrase